MRVFKLPGLTFSRFRTFSLNQRRNYAIGDHLPAQADYEEAKKLSVPELRERLRQMSLAINPNERRWRYGIFNTYSFARHLARSSAEHWDKPSYEAPFVREYDVVIFGGGIIGSSIAYWLKQRAPDSFNLAVVDRDLQYTHSATTLSVGGLRQQFSLPENVQMSLFSADFLRNSRRHLGVLDDQPPDLLFTPQGHLFLADESQANGLLEYQALQNDIGAYVEMMNAEQLKQRFPWLNTNDTVVGSYGLEGEGWFDPSSLLVALKGKAEFLGANYVEAEIVDMNPLSYLPSESIIDETGAGRDTCNHAVIRRPDGSIHNIKFSMGIFALGAETAALTQRLKIGEADGFREAPLPVEARKRYVYRFNCPDGPALDFPVLVDSSGVFCRRDGLGGNYICGKSPTQDQEPDSTNLDVDYSYFDKHIYPVLSQRVDAFRDLKVLGGWAGYYDYNTFDEAPVIGNHPYYPNLIWATGFGGLGVQMAPAVGRAIMELLLDYEYKTINLERFGWNRLIMGEKINERLVF